MRMSERRKCLEILNIVRSTEGRGKVLGKRPPSTRLLVEMFERLPMKSQLPEYYKIIRYPIDVATIEISLKSGVYASPWWFFVAMELVFANAQRYNDPATQMYHADAAVLRECMHSAAKDLFGSDVPFPVAGGDIYDDVEEPTEYKETRIIHTKSMTRRIRLQETTLSIATTARLYRKRQDYITRQRKSLRKSFVKKSSARKLPLKNMVTKLWMNKSLSRLWEEVG